jgi:hypothetical protein
LNFVQIEAQVRIQVRAGSSQSHQVGNTPRHLREQRQSAFQMLNRAELKRLDLAGIFQYVEQDLDFSARAIPIDQFDRRRKRAGFAAGQKAPFNRLGASWRIDLARDDAGGADVLAFPAGSSALRPTVAGAPCAL